MPRAELITLQGENTEKTYTATASEVAYMQRTGRVPHTVAARYPELMGGIVSGLIQGVGRVVGRVVTAVPRAIKERRQERRAREERVQATGADLAQKAMAAREIEKTKRQNTMIMAAAVVGGVVVLALLMRK